MANLSVAFSNVGNFPTVVVDGETLSGFGFTLLASGGQIYVQAGPQQIIIDDDTVVTIDGGSALTGDIAAKLASLQSGLPAGTFLAP